MSVYGALLFVVSLGKPLISHVAAWKKKLGAF
jgi:hypothetical protein